MASLAGNAAYGFFETDLMGVKLNSFDRTILPEMTSPQAELLPRRSFGKRLGVVCAEVTFRKIMKVETCLQAFQQNGLQVTRLIHQPRIPKGLPAKPRKQRCVSRVNRRLGGESNQAIVSLRFVRACVCARGLIA